MSVNYSVDTKPPTPTSVTNSDGKSSTLLEDTEERIIDVWNFLLLKRVAENSDKELSLVGTFVQEILQNIDEELGKMDTQMIEMDSQTEKINKMAENVFFDYRINDLGAEDTGWVKPRRIEMNKWKCKKTMQANLPLEIEKFYDCFPFRIVTASVMIELSSSSIHDQRRRPNLSVDNIAIQEIQPFDFIKEEDKERIKKNLDAAITKKLDKSPSYDFVSPFPEISYLYDTKKEYCPKFKVTFYMVESGVSKFVSTVFPMLLIAILNTVQVLDAMEVDIDTTNFLGNAASFALAAVFVLPSIVSENKSPSYLCMNNAYIMNIFIGLALSSLPDRLLGTKIPAFCGMVILWLSFAFPFWGFYHYYYHCYVLRKRLHEKRNGTRPTDMKHTTVKSICMEYIKDKSLPEGYTIENVPSGKFLVLRP